MKIILYVSVRVLLHGRWKSLKVGQGRRVTHDKLLVSDTGRSTEELKEDMLQREEWRKDILKSSMK